MAILLIHLRRIILLLSAVYFANVILSHLLSRRRNKVQVNGVQKTLHFRFWTYLYALYLYAVMINTLDVENLIFLVVVGNFP